MGMEDTGVVGVLALVLLLLPVREAAMCPAGTCSGCRMTPRKLERSG